MVPMMVHQLLVNVPVVEEVAVEEAALQEEVALQDVQQVIAVLVMEMVEPMHAAKPVMVAKILASMANVNLLLR